MIWTFWADLGPKDLNSHKEHQNSMRYVIIGKLYRDRWASCSSYGTVFLTAVFGFFIMTTGVINHIFHEI